MSQPSRHFIQTLESHEGEKFLQATDVSFGQHNGFVATMISLGFIFRFCDCAFVIAHLIYMFLGEKIHTFERMGSDRILSVLK